MALLSRTQTTCEAEPAPAEANCSLSRLARSCALNSPSVAAGKSLRTSKHGGILDKRRDRRELGQGVVHRLLAEDLAVDVRAAVAVQERVAVGRRLRDAVAAHHAAGAADVLDDHLLPEIFRQPRRHDARGGVDRTAGGERHHQRHRTRRPLLRQRGGRQQSTGERRARPGRRDLCFLQACRLPSGGPSSRERRIAVSLARRFAPDKRRNVAAEVRRTVAISPRTAASGTSGRCRAASPAPRPHRYRRRP